MWALTGFSERWILQLLERCNAEGFDAVYGVTDLSPEQAGPEKLLAYRDDPHIDDRLNWCPDVTAREDKSRVRSGSAPQATAPIRDTTLFMSRDQAKPLRSVRAALAEDRCSNHPSSHQRASLNGRDRAASARPETVQNEPRTATSRKRPGIRGTPAGGRSRGRTPWCRLGARRA